MSSRERGKTKSIKDSVDEFLDKFKLREGYTLNEIKIIWNSTMGQTISKRTTEIFYKDQKVFVKIESAALKHQLHMQRTELRDKLNKEIGSDLIKDLIFL
jgi:predicted nucleic acid-binding Zn ribbon protein